MRLFCCVGLLRRNVRLIGQVAIVVCGTADSPLIVHFYYTINSNRLFAGNGQIKGCNADVIMFS